MKKAWYKKIILNVVVGIGCALLSSISFSAQNTDGIQVYQKNLHLSEEHKQRLANDIYRYQNTADNVWDALRREFILPHYENIPQVQGQIAWFMNHQDFLVKTATRAAPYLYFILQQTRKRHLPAELVLLPMMESGYNPFAYSSVGAAGIWQMMPGTASGFGIKQNWWYDGRRDVIASTGAALDYLSYLGSFFEGNWLLAIAAYDTGEGNVLAGIRKNIRDARNTDYWSLPLAQETQIYVPRLLALAIIISHPDEYPIPFPAVRNAPYLAQIDIGAQIDINHAARLAGLSTKLFKQLNPGYSRSSMGPRGPYKVVLPIEHIQQFSENLARSPVYQELSLIRYKIRPGDTLASIAKKFNTSKMALRKSNPRLAFNLKPGKHLVIPNSAPTMPKKMLFETQQPYFTSSAPVDREIYRSAPASSRAPEFTQSNKIFTSNQTFDASKNDYHAVTRALENIPARSKYSLQPGDTLYMVRNGDDLQKIARRFHTSIDTIVAINQLDGTSYVRPGDHLIIPTHSVG